jgi:hypothetical protein
MQNKKAKVTLVPSPAEQEISPAYISLPAKKLNMQPVLLGHQFVYRFPVCFVGHTAIYRANGSALRLFMKSLAFGTLVWNDIVNIRTYGCIPLVGIHAGAIHHRKSPFYGGSIRDSPFNATFINRIVRTFGFAGPAIDTFFRDLYSHLS